MLGQSAWGVSLGYGSFVTMEFGAPVKRENPRKKVHGEWHLWIRYGFWRLQKGDFVLAGSEDDRSELIQQLEKLNGLSFQMVDIDPITFESKFFFSDDMMLIVIPANYLPSNLDYWMLYTNEDKVLVAGPGLRYKIVNYDDRV
jgi:hypothetical protein